MSALPQELDDIFPTFQGSEQAGSVTLISQYRLDKLQNLGGESWNYNRSFGSGDLD